MLKVLDLFSGIGGFSLGLESTSHFQTVAFCEIDPLCRKALNKQWPNTAIFEDIHDVPGRYFQWVDLICGGFPCQPVSCAGKRQGDADPRWLWPAMFRIIKDARPTWCLIENVPGLRTKHADDVLSDLEGQGYTCWPLVVGAIHAGAPHRRQRVWIVAYSQRMQRGALNIPRDRLEGEHGIPQRAKGSGRPRITGQSREASGRPARQPPYGAGTCRTRRGKLTNGSEQWGWGLAPEPPVRRVDDGVSRRVDLRKLNALGNAVVPQVVAAFGKQIAWLSELTSTNG